MYYPLLLSFLIILPYAIKSESVIFEFYIVRGQITWICFIVGIALYNTYDRIRTDYLFSLFLFVAILSFVFNNLMYICICFELSLVILALFLQRKGIGAPKLLVTIGDITFSIYSLHYYVMAFFSKFYTIQNLSLMNVILIIMLYILCVVIAYYEDKYFEKYIHKKIKMFLETNKEAQ